MLTLIYETGTQLALFLKRLRTTFFKTMAKSTYRGIDLFFSIICLPVCFFDLLLRLVSSTCFLGLVLENNDNISNNVKRKKDYQLKKMGNEQG